MASLGKDISKIRQKKKLTIEQIHEETRIPLHILETIETGAIFKDIEENKTYIRSYVRGYAKALDIDDELIIACLNKTEEGQYNGELLKQHTTSEQTAPTDESSANAKASDSTAKNDATPKQSFSKTWSYDQTSKPEPSVHSVNWANVGDNLGSLHNFSIANIAIPVIVLLIFGAVLYYYVFRDGEVTTPETPEQKITNNILSVDSLNNEFINIDTTSATDPDSVTTETLTPLPDTLNLIVYAAYDKLEPVRIISDVNNDTIPYWIEKGEAMRFNFIDSIKVRGQLARMEFMFNGHVVTEARDKFYNPESDFVELHRDFFEQPRWRSTPPDSIPIKAPPPDTIKNRPVF